MGSVFDENAIEYCDDRDLQLQYLHLILDSDPIKYQVLDKCDEKQFTFSSPDRLFNYLNKETVPVESMLIFTDSVCGTYQIVTYIRGNYGSLAIIRSSEDDKFIKIITCRGFNIHNTVAHMLLSTATGLSLGGTTLRTFPINITDKEGSMPLEVIKDLPKLVKGCLDFSCDNKIIKCQSYEKALISSQKYPEDMIKVLARLAYPGWWVDEIELSGRFRSP